MYDASPFTGRISPQKQTGRTQVSSLKRKSALKAKLAFITFPVEKAKKIFQHFFIFPQSQVP
jgi:hypothetical protein